MINSVYSITETMFKDEFASLARYRYTQMEKYRSQGLLSFDQYVLMGRDAISELKLKSAVFSSTLAERKSQGENVKYLLKLEDGNFIECVYMKDSNLLNTLCLSSQVGCACGCRFCATGTLGLVRNLADYEIIEQYYHLKRECGRIDKMVFMGMGEPLLNIDAVISAIKYLKEHEGISPRRITVSTCGISGGIRRLADAKLGVKLTLSLVVADQNQREKIMPTAKVNTLSELKKSLLYFQSSDARRITLAYYMLKGVNMDIADIKKLKDFSQGLVAHINLIPWNEVDALDFKSPSLDEIKFFRDTLLAHHLSCSVRYSKGAKIDAACGQLVANHKNNDKKQIAEQL